MSNPQFADARTVLLTNVRLSFTDTLIKPGTPKGVTDAKEKYGCNIVLEKDKPEFESNDAKVRAALREAGKQFKGNEDLYKIIAENNAKRVAYRRGEAFRNDDGKVYEGYEGNFAISATGPSGGAKRPSLRDRYKREVTKDSDVGDVFYSGTYADCIVSFYGTDKGGQGIFCSIEGIRSRQEGDRMGGGGVTVTEDMFADLPGDDSFDDLPDDGKNSGSETSGGLGL